MIQAEPYENRDTGNSLHTHGKAGWWMLHGSPLHMPGSSNAAAKGRLNLPSDRSLIFPWLR